MLIDCVAVRSVALIVISPFDVSRKVYTTPLGELALPQSAELIRTMLSMTDHSQNGDFETQPIDFDAPLHNRSNYQNPRVSET